jgi:putative FmdB family regulatory protein
MTYEYICKACGHQWEAEQSISADPLKDCPACGKAEAKRQISRGGGFILKGGGWYSDLYASSSKSSGSDSAGDTSASKSASGAGDTKTGEAKADKPAAATTSPTAASSSAGSSD